MRRWTEVADAVAATTRTSQKTAILAAYLRSLAPDDLAIACTFFTGRPFPEGDPRSAGLGCSGVSGAVIALAGASPDALGRAYDRSSDLGRDVEDLLRDSGHGEVATILPASYEKAVSGFIDRLPMRKDG